MTKINMNFEIVTADKTFYMDMTDLEFSSLYKGEHHSESTREELHGLPVLHGFIGPCYNGLDDQGRAKIRYESYEVYRAISID